MKTVLLTGASGGIGAAIKELLEQEGNTVISIDHAEVDLSSYAEIEKFEQKIASEGMRFDWVVLSHGFIDTETDFKEQTLENIERTFMLNTLSHLYLTKLLLRHLNPGGGIVFISSTAGINGNGFYAAYSASKGAINTFAQALARRYEEYSFYSLCPGPTDTAMRQKIGGGEGAQASVEVAKAVSSILGGAYTSGDVIVVRKGEVSLASTLAT